MKASSLKEQTNEELLQTLSDKRKQLNDMRLRRGAGADSEQPLLARMLRRDSARVLTEMRQRGLKENG